MASRLSSLSADASSRGAVLVTAVVGLTTPVRALGRGLVTVDWEGPAVVIAILLDVLGTGGIAWVLTWLVYGMAFWYLLPSVYPGRAGKALEEAPGVRTVICLSIVAVGTVIEREVIGTFAGNPLPTQPDGVPMGVVVVVVAGIVPLVAFAVHDRTDLTGRDGVVAAAVLKFAPESEEDTEPATGIHRVAGIIAFLIIGVLIFGWITLLLVAAALVAVVLFPVPEVLAVAGGLVAVLTPDRANKWRRAADVENRLLTIARVGTYGFKGMFGVLLPVAGIVLAAVASLVVVLAVGFGVRDGITGSLQASEILQAAVVIPVLALTAWYSLWYWLRILDRLPHFIEVWNARQPVVMETPEPTRPLKARPPGLLIQPTLVFVVLAVPVTYPWSLLVVGVPSLALCVWMLWNVRRPRRHEPIDSVTEPVVSDNIAIPAAFLVQFGGFGIVANRDAIVTAVTGTPEAIVPVVSSALLVLLFVSVFYFSDAIRPLVAEDHSWGRREIALWLWLVGVLVANQVIQGRPLFAVVVVAVLVGVLIWAVMRRRRPKSAG